MDIHETMEPAPFNKPNIHGSFLSINIIFPNQILGFPRVFQQLSGSKTQSYLWVPLQHVVVELVVDLPGKSERESEFAQKLGHSKNQLI